MCIYVHAYEMPQYRNFHAMPYSGKLSRTINFAVFKDFSTTSKIVIFIEFYESLVDPRNLIPKIYCGGITSKIFNLKNLQPRKLPAIRYIRTYVMENQVTLDCFNSHLKQNNFVCIAMWSSVTLWRSYYFERGSEIVLLNYVYVFIIIVILI